MTERQIYEDVAKKVLNGINDGTYKHLAFCINGIMYTTELDGEFYELKLAESKEEPLKTIADLVEERAYYKRCDLASDYDGYIDYTTEEEAQELGWLWYIKD